MVVTAGMVCIQGLKTRGQREKAAILERVDGFSAKGCGMRIGMGDEIVNTFLISGLGLAGLCGYAARGKQGGAGATAQAP